MASEEAARSERQHQESVFYDILINFYMNNPELYEKMEEDYSINAKKLEKLMILSAYLKQLHISKEVPDIIRAWQDLVTKFKKQLSLENCAKSGSGSSETASNTCPYFDSLAFLRPACQNRPVLSTIQLNSNNIHHGISPKDRIQTVQSTSYPSTSSSLYKPFVPEYDGHAKKKMRFMTEEENNIKFIGQKLVETLDNINQKIEEGKQEVVNQKSESQSTRTDYRALLSAAVEKIPAGQENQFLECIFEDLDNFDKEMQEK